jgi:small subunit ribosomal protein S8
MSHSDPIADMLTRIRNSIQAKQRKVDMPSSKMKQEIAKILAEEKFIADYKVIGEGLKKTLRIHLKYTTAGEPAIQGIKRVSMPGLRRYAGSSEMQPVNGGLGIAVVSTSQGVLSDLQCKEMNIGGEVLAHVW